MYPYWRVDVGYRLFQMVLVLLVTKQNTVTMSRCMIEISKRREAHHEPRMNSNRQITHNETEHCYMGESTALFPRLKTTRFCRSRINSQPLPLCYSSLYNHATHHSINDGCFSPAYRYWLCNPDSYVLDNGTTVECLHKRPVNDNWDVSTARCLSRTNTPI